MGARFSLCPSRLRIAAMPAEPSAPQPVPAPIRPPMPPASRARFQGDWTSIMGLLSGPLGCPVVVSVRVNSFAIAVAGAGVGPVDFAGGGPTFKYCTLGG